MSVDLRLSAKPLAIQEMGYRRIHGSGLQGLNGLCPDDVCKSFVDATYSKGCQW